MNERPLTQNAILFDAVRAIEESRRRIAVVTDASGRLLGTLTDGDVRRCLLSCGSLDTPATEAMNQNPVTAQASSTDGHILDLMKKANVLSVPIVDLEGRFLRLVHLSDLSFEAPEREAACFSTAVIMAGGEGTRLRPLTENIPKPMIKVGGIPLLERQVRRLARAGIERIFISVNYLGEVIEEYFGDGSKFGATIEYLREPKKLGTAGALSLLPERPEGPLLVLNGDIVTTSDFVGLFDYHCSHGGEVTVAAIEYNVQIPFGVLRTSGLYALALEEKPSQRFLCNAGIYSLSPAVLDVIPDGRFYDMTQLIRDCLTENRRVAIFPVHEYWSDIGTPDDLAKAQKFFADKVKNK